MITPESIYKQVVSKLKSNVIAPTTFNGDFDFLVSITHEHNRKFGTNLPTNWDSFLSLVGSDYYSNNNK